MKLNGLSKIGWLRLLMVTAQVMLAALVVLWLRGQLKEQRRFLETQTAMIIGEVEREVFDTLLLTTLVRPMLDTGTKVNFRFTFNTDSIRRISKKLPTGTGLTNLPLDQTTVAFAITDTIKKSGNRHSITMRTRSDKSRMVIQGVKLFISELTDTASQYSFFSDSLLQLTDSVLFRQKLEEKLQASLPGIGFKTIPSALPSFHPDSIFNFDDSLNQFPKVEFSGTSLWLARQLIAEMLFALAVLALSATASIVAFRSLKNQMMLNQMRDDFVRNISHELKTPVATVKVALEALQNFNQKTDPDKLSRYLNMAGQEMNRLELLINRVLNTSGHSQQQDLLVTDLIDLKQLIEETLLLITPQVEKANAVVKLDIMPDNGMFNGDKLQLQGMLINLIDNALKYGGVPPIIEINLKRSANAIEIVVSDQGPGIPLQYHQKVFERFFRVSTGDVHTIKGHGLGLTYALMVARLHGGKIELTTPETGGARFTVKLPVA